MATTNTRAKVFETLQVDMANRMAIEANHQDKLEKLAGQMESHQAQFDHSITTLDMKYDGLSSAIEMLSLQVLRAVERMNNYYSRDKPIMDSSAPPDHQFHQTQFMGTSSQTPISSSLHVDPRKQRNIASGDHPPPYSGHHSSHRLEFPRFD